MRRMLVIAYYTFLECIRNKVLVALFVFLMLSVCAATFFKYMTHGEEIKLLKDFMLGSIAIIGIVVSIFLPISVVSLEMEKHTLYVILSKPVRRYEYIVAKYLGVLFTLGVTFVCMIPVFMAILYAKEGMIDFTIVKPIVLLFFKFSIVTAFSIFFNILTTTHVLAVLISIIFYILGHLSVYISEIITRYVDFALSKSALLVMAHCIPNLAIFDISDSIAIGIAVPWIYIVKSVLYALIYSSITLTLASIHFSKKDL
ncbi:MAG: hypothetical protein P9M13_02340 [Candidatus Ancaeobacter aquaticus]|nr:hypothetical protein [Candidatus Ancaeobacter aquaticus]